MSNADKFDQGRQVKFQISCSNDPNTDHSTAFQLRDGISYITWQVETRTLTGTFKYSIYTGYVEFTKMMYPHGILTLMGAPEMILTKILKEDITPDFLHEPSFRFAGPWHLGKMRTRVRKVEIKDVKLAPTTETKAGVKPKCPDCVMGWEAELHRMTNGAEGKPLPGPTYLHRGFYGDREWCLAHIAKYDCKSPSVEGFLRMERERAEKIEELRAKLAS